MSLIYNIVYYLQYKTQALRRGKDIQVGEADSYFRHFISCCVCAFIHANDFFSCLVQQMAKNTKMCDFIFQNKIDL